jgi:hypothetical protein
MILAGLLAMGVAAAAAEAGPQVLSASTTYDLIGRQSVPKYATLQIKAASKVTCIAAEASPVPNSYATCYVVAPGFHGDVPAGESVVASGPGAVRLGCDGYPYPITCSARVGD